MRNTTTYCNTKRVSPIKFFLFTFLQWLIIQSLSFTKTEIIWKHNPNLFPLCSMYCLDLFIAFLKVYMYCWNPLQQFEIKTFVRDRVPLRVQFQLEWWEIIWRTKLQASKVDVSVWCDGFFFCVCVKHCPTVVALCRSIVLKNKKLLICRIRLLGRSIVSI